MATLTLFFDVLFLSIKGFVSTKIHKHTLHCIINAIGRCKVPHDYLPQVSVSLLTTYLKISRYPATGPAMPVSIYKNNSSPQTVVGRYLEYGEVYLRIWKMKMIEKVIEMTSHLKRHT